MIGSHEKIIRNSEFEMQFGIRNSEFGIKRQKQKQKIFVENFELMKGGCL